MYPAVEDSDPVAVQNSDVGVTKLRQGVVVDTPVLIPEEAVTLALALTSLRPILLFQHLAYAASSTVVY